MAAAVISVIIPVINNRLPVVYRLVGIKITVVPDIKIGVIIVTIKITEEVMEDSKAPDIKVVVMWEHIHLVIPDIRVIRQVITPVRRLVITIILGLD